MRKRVLLWACSSIAGFIIVSLMALNPTIIPLLIIPYSFIIGLLVTLIILRR